jgi:hypothetical protein
MPINQVAPNFCRSVYTSNTVEVLYEAGTCLPFVSSFINGVNGRTRQSENTTRNTLATLGTKDAGRRHKQTAQKTKKMSQLATLPLPNSNLVVNRA